MNTDELVVLTNIGIIVVTAAATAVTVIMSFREAHRHEEHQTDELAHIVHEILEQEHQMEDNRHSEAEEARK